jgi:hypothetical protein
VIFDINNPPLLPDSNLKSDLNLMFDFNINNGIISIAPGDWVDVSECVLIKDVNTGTSFQVCNVFPISNEIGILYSSDNGITYSQTILSTSWVENNFRSLIKG